MQKILNQEEIDALFKRARGIDPDAETQQRHVAQCDFRSAGQITKEQLRVLNLLHEAFARNLSHSLGAYFRIALEMAVVSVEQLPYGEFLQRIPDLTYFSTLKVNGLDVSGGINIDLPVAYPMLDLLLGGRGRPEPDLRELTEIEQEILGNVMVSAVKELTASWETMGIGFTLEKRIARDEISGMILPTERVLAVSFEVRLPEVLGTLNVVFPSLVSSLLQRASQKASRKQSSAVHSERVHARILQSGFLVELELPTLKVPARELLEMREGSVLALPYKIQQPACLMVGGAPLFAAYPVAHEGKRASYVHRITPIRREENRGQYDGDQQV